MNSSHKVAQSHSGKDRISRARVRKGAVLIVLGVIVVAALVPVFIYVASEWRLRVYVMPSPFSAELPVDAASLDWGRHVARTRGCFGCHGQQLEGLVFTEWPWVKRAVAPPLAEYAKSHTVAELEAVIRHGINPDGKALWSMPSYNWVHLSDTDLLALIAYLRSEPTMDADLPDPAMGLKARAALVFGDETHMAQWVTEIPALQLQQHPDAQLGHGEYLAMTMCIECHGFDLRGDNAPEGGTPDLAILAAYSDEDFRTLMKTGTALGGRDDLPLMSMIARDRFASLSDAELDDLLAYLRTLPASSNSARK